jgi:hypothetical protein
VLGPPLEEFPDELPGLGDDQSESAELLDAEDDALEARLNEELGRRACDGLN